ncbi:hypothetical protein PsorP6_014999 [Peronosclerospora sorghi]|uniref:Uncharacterized protein n=1 Tax=Peronosclerospora sorghi TaxID=230839 RepID=A0ACC0VU30_9STRA|nr:hypothetical protein PsorP6_014999 [Peronosclerospora sorghi]
MKRMVYIGDFPPKRACLDVAEGQRPLVNVLNGLVASLFVDSITCLRDVNLLKDFVNLRIGNKDLTELLGASHVMGLSVQVTTRNKRDPRLVRETHPLVAHPLEHELAPQRFEVQKLPIERGFEFFLLVLDHVSLLPIQCTDRVERTTVHGLACPLFDYEVHFQRQLLHQPSQRLHLLPSFLHIPSLSLHLIVTTSGTLDCAWFAVPRGFRRLRLLTANSPHLRMPVSKLLYLVAVVTGMFSGLSCSFELKASHPILYAGTFTRDEDFVNGTEKGIYTFKFYTTTGSLTSGG